MFFLTDPIEDWPRDWIDYKNNYLSDLFQPGSDYIERISAMIKEQIEQQEIPLLRPFERIGPNEGYYLESENLVIYFQTYDYTPYYIGIPEFRIPYTAIADILAPNSPVRRIMRT